MAEAEDAKVPPLSLDQLACFEYQLGLEGKGLSVKEREVLTTAACTHAHPHRTCSITTALLDSQACIVCKTKQLREERREDNHGDGDEIDVDGRKEEEMWDHAAQLTGGFLAKYIRASEQALTELVDNPDTLGRVAASPRESHRLLALGGSALMSLMSLRSWRECMEGIGFDAAYTEFCKDPRFTECTKANFVRALFHGALKHRSWSTQLLIKLIRIVACYYGIKISLQVVVGGSIPQEVADAFGWVHHQNEMGRVQAFSNMFNDEGLVADGCLRRMTVVDYNGADVTFTFGSRRELCSIAYDLHVGKAGTIMRSYAVLEDGVTSTEEKAGSWVDGLADPECTSRLADGARQWTVEKQMPDGSWERECGREGWSPHLCSELNRLLPRLNLQFPPNLQVLSRWKS